MDRLYIELDMSQSSHTDQIQAYYFPKARLTVFQNKQDNSVMAWKKGKKVD